MGGVRLTVIFALLSIGCQCAAQDFTASEFTVTSRSIAVKWNKFPGASAYRITATKIDLPQTTVSTVFGPNIVLGSVNSLYPSTRHTIKVEALDSNSNVIAESRFESTTAPAVPTIEKATSKQSQSMTLEFDTVDGATSYILRAENDNSFSETEVLTSPGTVPNLQPYTQYTFSVLSKNSKGGRSQPSLPVVARTVLPAPQLNTTSPSNDTIVVTWEPVDNAVLYTIHIIKQGSSPSKSSWNTTEKSITFGGLEAGTVYTITAYAWDAEDREGDRDTVDQITRPATPGSIELSVIYRPEAALLVSWAPVSGASDYQAESSNGLSCNSTDPTCILTPVVCGQKFTVTVFAINEAGFSHPSAPVEFHTFPCPPQHLKVEEKSPGNCSLTWSSAEYADSYVAYVKRDDGKEFDCNTTDTTCDFHCVCSYTYWLSVYAHNQAGSSPPGAVLNYTTLPCCPENVQVSLVSADTLEINWDKVRSVEVYETQAVFGSKHILCNDTAPVCALSDLTCDTPYTVNVIPCNERGCNRGCSHHTRETAPCTPEDLNVIQINTTTIKVAYTTPNRQANYQVTLTSEGTILTCESSGGYCVVYELPCGTTYEVSAVAITAAGRSLPSYTVALETAPCCPESLHVDQVTQAMSNVTWSPAVGAQSYITSLNSSRGDAGCHTLETHCVVGCITCGTNYTVDLVAISRTGHKSQCNYQGFSSSACCPPGVKLYKLANNTIRIYWRSSSGVHKYKADLYGITNYTCTAAPGVNFCDVPGVMWGYEYTVVVAPLNHDGTKVNFCSERKYFVSDGGNPFYRGKRSVD